MTIRIVLDTSTFIKATIERDSAARSCISLVLKQEDMDYVVTEEMAKELVVASFQAAVRKGKNPIPVLRIASTYLLYATPVREMKTKFP